MDVSVVVPTHNQQERLALVLCGLVCQTFDRDRFEVLVVDDGCTDGTPELVQGFAARGKLAVRLLGGGERRGRNRARNLGLEAAAGELTVFLDADALPDPELLQQYWRASREGGPGSVLSGVQYHLPQLEFLKDPRTGELLAGVEISSVVRDWLACRRHEVVVTEHQVRADFDSIRRRARMGSYPDEGAILRQEQARDLLRARPCSTSGWLAFIPHNGAAATSLLRAAGGFDDDIPFSEGWELAYRLQRGHGACVRLVEAATYHLYHFHDFSDRAQAATRFDAIEYMAAKHRDPRIRLVYFWFAHLWPDRFIPDASLVRDLFEFDRLYHELPDELWRQYEMVLRHHPSHLPLEDVEVNYEKRA